MCEVKNWSEWDREDLVYHAKSKLEEWLKNRPQSPGWVVDVDRYNRLYAYNYEIVVSTEPIFIPHPIRLADEVHRRICELDPIITY